MECPQCNVNIHEKFAQVPIGVNGAYEATEVNTDKARQYNSYFSVNYMSCPACNKLIIFLHEGELIYPTRQCPNLATKKKYLIRPVRAARPKASKEVPLHIAEDFNEACIVITFSPKASAALSRRCLQAILHDKGYTQHNLIQSIDAVIATNTLPPVLSENLHSVRIIGNFAAHPLKDTNTLAILPVESEEAEWNLDVVEELFDFYYVQPANALKKKAALNAKLTQAGKPTI